MPDKISISIGIPAYNEQANIRNLLSSILGLTQDHFVLEKIFVANDGSTDKTASEASAVSDPRVILVNDGRRAGKAARLNQIHEQCESDLLVTLDADVKFKDSMVLESMARKFLLSRADLVCGIHRPLPAKNFVQRLANFGVDIWNEAAAHVSANRERYSANGQIMGLSKKLYKSLRYPDAVYANDDMFCFYFAKIGGYEITVADDAVVLYRSPATVADYVRQMKRILKHSDSNTKFFGADAVKNMETMTAKQKYAALGRKIFATKPHVVLGYLALQAYTKVASKFYKPQAAWESVGSSKELQ